MLENCLKNMLDVLVSISFRKVLGLLDKLELKFECFKLSILMDFLRYFQTHGNLKSRL